MSTNNNKYVKGTPDWDKKIIGLVGQEEEKIFKKDEIKPDGTKVTSAQETIKVNDIQQLLTEIKSQKKTVETKLAELGQKKGYKGEALALFKLIKELEPKVKDWKQFTNWYNQAYERFLKGGTNGYGAGNSGWIKVLKAYLEQKYRPANSLSLTEAYADNLYRGTFQMGQTGNDHTKFRITENEAVKLITRTVKEISQIKKPAFDAYVNGAGQATLADGTWRPASQFTSTNVISWMDNLRDRAKYLVDNTIKGTILDENGNKVDHPDKGKPANGHRIEYSFGDDYTKKDGNPVAPNNFTHTELEQLFNLMKLFSDYAWVNHNSLKPALTEIKGETLILLPAEQNPLKSEKLKYFGLEGYIDTNGNSNFYATNYGTRLSDGAEYRPVEYSWDSQFEVKVEDNLQDWARLINSFSCEQYADEKNKHKLISSFTNDPIKQLFADLRSYDTTSSTATDKGGTGTDPTPNYDIFTDGTNHYSYQEFPEFYLDQESRWESLQANKEVITEEIKAGRKELDQAEKDYQTARKQLFAKEKEIDDKITAKITELRKELKDKFKVDDPTTNDFTGNNKLTQNEHHQFQQLVQNIRFLVNNDDQKPTGKTNEEQAYLASKNLTDKIATEFWGVTNGWFYLTPEGGSESCKTDEERIQVIKEGKGIFQRHNLNYYHDKFIELEKIVKLDEWQVQAKTKLKAAIDQQTPIENLNDWRNTLKIYETGLESVLTDEKITKWKEKKDGQDAFNNLAGLETLLKKVVVMKKDAENKEVFDKVNDDFLTFIKQKEAKLENLSKLIELQEPQEVILLIHQWEYDKLDETKKKQRHLHYAWSELGGKKEVDSYELTEEDKKTGGNFEKFLYQTAIGKIVESSLSKPSEQQEDKGHETPSEENKSWFKFSKDNIGKPALTYTGIFLLVVSVLAIIFWKQITGWWNGPAEETEISEGQASSDKEENEDEKEE